MGYITKLEHDKLQDWIEMKSKNLLSRKRAIEAYQKAIKDYQLVTLSSDFVTTALDCAQWINIRAIKYLKEKI